MSFLADLHIHSKYSRATSGQSDLFHLAQAAMTKGLALLGSGDFTHPAWREEMATHLREGEGGLYRLSAELERTLTATTIGTPPHFMITGEISTIYKKGERTRKIHHLLCLSSLQAAGRLCGLLERVGNLRSDGRPILGLESRNLLELLLTADPLGMLIPAHIWTPWFSVLGSKAGFDSVTACYGDLASEIHALETGLSSDPPMNWRLSMLDGYRLVSFSDAHSPSRLGREATRFHTPLAYAAIRQALRGGEGFGGTLEFFPEEGKYHLDGHRDCRVCWEPGQTVANGGVCPVCGQGVTVGVLHRVQALADRPEGYVPLQAAPFQSLVPLPEVLGEVLGVGSGSVKVARLQARLIQTLGPELPLLLEVPLEELRQQGGARLAEGVGRMRRGEVMRQAGYDGLFGTIRLLPE